MPRRVDLLQTASDISEVTKKLTIREAGKAVARPCSGQALSPSPVWARRQQPRLQLRGTPGDVFAIVAKQKITFFANN